MVKGSGDTVTLLKQSYLRDSSGKTTTRAADGGESKVGFDSEGPDDWAQKESGGKMQICGYLLAFIWHHHTQRWSDDMYPPVHHGALRNPDTAISCFAV